MIVDIIRGIYYSVDIDLKKASNNRKEGFFLE